MWEGIYHYRQLLSLAAVVFSIIGTIILLGKPALRYFRGYVLSDFEIRKEIEDEAIGVAFNRLAPESRSERLTDSIARGFVITYKSAFWGFVVLFSAFVLQTMSSLSDVLRPQ